MGWAFNPKYYNKAYVTEATKVVLQYGFQSEKSGGRSIITLF
ncbi:MAG: hypothetical protein RR587_05225 [Solibacillus sp.]